MLTLDNIGREVQSLARAEKAKGWVEGYIAGLFRGLDKERPIYHVEMFSVVNKIQAIKVMREFTGLGLRDAKWLVENADVSVHVTNMLSEAEMLQSRLEAVGEVAFIRRTN